MTQALGIAQGRFGRVALLDMDTSLVGHAHHHCHILLKVAGSDSSFVVGDTILPMRDDTAVLVNAWERHHYQHSAQAPRTVFLALYIEPSWIAEIDRSFAPFGQAGFFAQNCMAIGPEIRRLGQDLAHCLAAGSEDAKQLIGDIVLSAMHHGAERPGLPGPAPDAGLPHPARPADHARRPGRRKPPGRAGAVRRAVPPALQPPVPPVHRHQPGTVQQRHPPWNKASAA